MRYVPLLRRFQEQFKLARAYGICNLMAAHRLTDWNAVGAEGSEAARLARGLLEDSGFTIVYRQVEAAMAANRDLLGLTDVQAALLRHLRKGTGMWIFGQRAFVVQHLMSSIEEPLVQTDTRMCTQPGRDVSDEAWDALLDDTGGPS
jgi:hypothetical protein